jgi:hypothetical protein
VVDWCSGCITRVPRHPAKKNNLEEKGKYGPHRCAGGKAVYKRALVIFLAMLLFSDAVSGQESNLMLGNFPPALRDQNFKISQEKPFEQKDIYDWLVQKKVLKKRPVRKRFLLIVPVIASNPTAGIILGAGLTYAYKSNPDGLKISSVTGNATWSTKGLINLNLKSNVFVLHEQVILNGDWRYLVNSETTYGLGSGKYPSHAAVNANGYTASTDSIGQPLQFSQIRLHETASLQLLPNFYAGIGFQFDSRFDIKDHTLEAGDSSASFHYRYSLSNGFDPSHYTTSGPGLNLLFDNRDNQVNAYRGWYVNLNYLINSEFLGSSANSSLLLTEYRSFHALGKKQNGQILAFWLYGNFVVTGKVPYLSLPAFGHDQRQRTGRGYPFGTFRGEDCLIAESEFRFPVSANTGILGGVLFVNAGSTSSRTEGIRLLQYIRPGYGAGLRIMIEKRSRTRLQIDAAVANRQIGFYFGAQETF